MPRALRLLIACALASILLPTASAAAQPPAEDGVEAPAEEAPTVEEAPAEEAPAEEAPAEEPAPERVQVTDGAVRSVDGEGQPGPQPVEEAASEEAAPEEAVVEEESAELVGFQSRIRAGFRISGGALLDSDGTGGFGGVALYTAVRVAPVLAIGILTRFHAGAWSPDGCPDEATLLAAGVMNPCEAYGGDFLSSIDLGLGFELIFDGLVGPGSALTVGLFGGPMIADVCNNGRQPLEQVRPAPAHCSRAMPSGTAVVSLLLLGDPHAELLHTGLSIGVAGTFAYLAETSFVGDLDLPPVEEASGKVTAFVGLDVW